MSDSKKSPASKRDAKDLDRAISAYNDCVTGNQIISNTDLALFAATLGGASHRQVWCDYRNGKRRILARDKVIVAIRLDTRPERIFHSWRGFTRWPLLIDALEGVSDTREQLLFGELLSEFATVTREQRRVVIEKLRALT